MEVEDGAESEEPESDQIQEEGPSDKTKRLTAKLAEMKRQTLSPAKKVPETSKPKAAAKPKAVQPAGKKKPAEKSAAKPVVEAPVDTAQPAGSSSSSSSKTLKSIAALYEAQAAIMRSFTDE